MTGTDPEGAAAPAACPDPAELARFLDRAFGGEPGIAAEFPTLTEAANRPRSFAIEVCGRIASHAAWRPILLHSGERRIAAAGIGLVATAPEQRGRGLAQRLVAHCVAEAVRGGAELALMFGELTPLYARLRFARAGRERITRLEPGDPARELRIARGGPTDAARLLPLLARHALRAERSAADFERVLGIPQTHLWIAERRGVPLAYCVEGKGRDLQGVVHEWAGEPASVAALLRAVASRAGVPLALLSPACIDPPVEGDQALGALALFRVLRPERLGSADAVELLGDERRPARLPVYLWGLDSI
jgi:predicted N-acetyltransferase YhbS